MHSLVLCWRVVRYYVFPLGIFHQCFDWFIEVHHIHMINVLNKKNCGEQWLCFQSEWPYHHKAWTEDWFACGLSTSSVSSANLAVCTFESIPNLYYSISGQSFMSDKQLLLKLCTFSDSVPYVLSSFSLLWPLFHSSDISICVLSIYEYGDTHKCEMWVWLYVINDKSSDIYIVYWHQEFSDICWAHTYTYNLYNWKSLREIENLTWE